MSENEPLSERIKRIFWRALMADVMADYDYAHDTRTCTCHPDDNPPKPCARKYAYSECSNAAVKPRREAAVAPASPCYARPTKENDMEHFNRLTPAEAERLALLAEECGEVIQAIGKVLRHGFESTHPDGGPTNREALERECGDVYHAIWRLIGAGDIDGNGMSQRADDKAKSVVRYLHHQGHNSE